MTDHRRRFTAIRRAGKIKIGRKHTAVLLVGAVSAVVVSVTEPHLLDAALVAAFELIGLAGAEGRAVGLIRTVTAVGLAITDIVRLKLGE